MWILYGDITELGKTSRGLGKRCLFFLTVLYPEIRLSGDRVINGQSTLSFEVSDVLLLVLEKPRDSFICSPGRTHNRIRSPMLAASRQ